MHYKRRISVAVEIVAAKTLSSMSLVRPLAKVRNGPPELPPFIIRMIETDRLIFRPFTPNDLPWLIEMRSPEPVNRYLGGIRMQNPEALGQRIKFYIECY